MELGQLAILDGLVVASVAGRCLEAYDRSDRPGRFFSVFGEPVENCVQKCVMLKNGNREAVNLAAPTYAGRWRICVGGSFRGG